MVTFGNYCVRGILGYLEEINFRKMGKIRKNKPSKHKKGGADSSDEEEQVPMDSKENAIQTILDQLQVSK